MLLMSALKGTIIVIIVASYLIFQCAYAAPPRNFKSELTPEAVKCINNLAAYFKIPSPYTRNSEQMYDDLLVASSRIPYYTYSPYLNEDEINYEGRTNLTKLMLVKGAIAHLIQRESHVNVWSASTNYYKMLASVLISRNIKTPLQFCQEENPFIMKIIDYLNLPFIQSTCMHELKDFPQESGDEVLAYAYLRVDLSEFAQSPYGTAYMRHIINDVQVMEASQMNTVVEPDTYCKYVTSNYTSNQ